MNFLFLLFYDIISTTFGGDIIKTLEEVRDEIIIIENEIEESCFYSGRSSKSYREVMNRLSELYDIEKLLKSKKLISGEEIDIYETRSIGDVVYYLISLHDTLNLVGFIKVNYSDSVDNFYGNVGYEIKEEYRGNSYAYKALYLLSDVMIERGLFEIVLRINEENIPSLMTAKKIGADFVSHGTKAHPYDKYHVNLKEKVKKLC